MERLYKTRAIVLRKKRWRENDLLFSFYTEEYGKIEAVAVGARKLKSKLNGHLTTLGIIELLFVKGKSVNRITHAYLVESFSLTEHDHLYYLSAIMEITEKAISSESRVENVWVLLAWVLKELDQSDNNERKKFLLNIFITKMLSVLGYGLKTNHCVKCGQEIKQVRRFSFTSYGFVCSNCRGGEINVLQKNYELIKLIQNNNFPSKLKIAPTDNNTLFIFLRRYITYFLEREIKSLNYIR